MDSVDGDDDDVCIKLSMKRSRIWEGIRGLYEELEGYRGGRNGENTVFM